MSSNGVGGSTVRGPAITEMDAICPTVKLKGAPNHLLHCMAVEDNTDFIPSKALIRVGANEQDIPSPITLNAYGWDKIKKGAGVQVTAGKKTIFAGCLVRRHDQGQQDNIVWEAHDYRYLLTKIPQVGAGCLVWDPVEEVPKFLTRYTPRTNPSGMRNCTLRGGFPMFSWVAEAADGDSSTDLVFWTPERWLKYVQRLITTARGGWEGSDQPYWRTITDSPLQWPTFNFPSDSDMNHKMPDVPMNGLKALAAIERGFATAKSYGLVVRYRGDQCELGFYVTGGNSEYGQDTGMDLPFLRGGNIDDIKTCYDFDMSEDALEVVESVATLGDPVMLEADLFYDADSADPVVNSDLLINFTDAEVYAFKYCIYGGVAGATPVPTSAKMPNVSNAGVLTREELQTLLTNTDLFVACDGLDGRPVIAAGTSAAVALARQLFPRVYRSFTINSVRLSTEGVMDGPSGQFSNLGRFPVLQASRPILEQQLTSVLGSANSDSKQRWPIRMRLRYEDGTYRDVSQFTGVRSEPDGSIWFDGLTDDVNAEELIYAGSLIPNPWGVELRAFRLNCAFPCDHRVTGYSEVPSEVDEDFSKGLGGPFCDIVDAPKGYRFEGAVLSEPAAGFTAYSADIRDERQEASLHAQQMVRANCRSKIFSSWFMPGIRFEYRAGQFIRKVLMRQNRSDDQDYLLNSPLRALTWDFIKQHTIVGGMISSGEISPQPNRTDVNRSDTGTATVPKTGSAPATSSNDSSQRTEASSSTNVSSANGGEEGSKATFSVPKNADGSVDQAALTKGVSTSDLDEAKAAWAKNPENPANQGNFAETLATDKLKGNQSPAALAQKAEDDQKAKAASDRQTQIKNSMKTGDQIDTGVKTGKGINYQAPDKRTANDMQEEKYQAAYGKEASMTDDKKAEARGRGEALTEDAGLNKFGKK